MNNSYKRTNFKGFAKQYFNSSFQFKFYSKINTPNRITTLKNMFFAQNLLHLTHTNYMNNILRSKIMLMLTGDNNITTTDDEDSEIENFANMDVSITSLRCLGMLCERIYIFFK